VITGFQAIEDLTSTVSDALDTLGIPGRAIGAGAVAPLAEGQRTCGPAVTLRYVLEERDPGELLRQGAPSGLGDRALFAAAPPGSVAVIDAGGHCEAASLGGIGASVAVAAGLAGVVVNGSVRDAAALLSMGLPVWCRGRSPLSGRHRLATVESGGVVAVAGLRVRPGDLVAGDSTGLCVVPPNRAAEVLEVCRAIEQQEADTLATLREHSR
jgi:regulator of RNase E activity RraA